MPVGKIVFKVIFFFQKSYLCIEKLFIVKSFAIKIQSK